MEILIQIPKFVFEKIMLSCNILDNHEKNINNNVLE